MQPSHLLKAPPAMTTPGSHSTTHHVDVAAVGAGDAAATAEVSSQPRRRSGAVRRPAGAGAAAKRGSQAQGAASSSLRSSASPEAAHAVPPATAAGHTNRMDVDAAAQPSAAAADVSLEQQPKRRRVEPQQGCQHSPAAAPTEPQAAAAAVAPDVEQHLAAIAAEIEALARQVDVSAPGAAADGDAEDILSQLPVLPPLPGHDVWQHSSRNSSGKQTPADDGSAAPAAGAAAKQDVSQKHPSTRMVEQHDETLTRYARMKAQAEAEAAKAAAVAKVVSAATAAKEAAAKAAAAQAAAAKAAAAKAAAAEAAAAFSAAQRATASSVADAQAKRRDSNKAGVPHVPDEKEELRGTPGFVPNWLREWRPKARAAAAAAQQKAREQRRKAAAAARQNSQPSARQQPVHAAPHQQQQQRQDHPQSNSAAEHSGGHAGAQQHHKHLALMLDALLDDTGDMTSPNTGVPTPMPAAGPMNQGALEGVKYFAFSARMLAPSQPQPQQMPQQQQAQPQEPQQQQQGNSHAAGSQPCSPDAATGPGQQACRSPSEQPQGSGAAPSREGSKARSSNICVLDKHDWAQLSAAAGFKAAATAAKAPQGQRGQGEQQQAKPERSFAHLARAVQSYRGVFALENSGLYEVRMYRSKLGQVVRLGHHPDAVSAARAFDRAALCLARASLSSKAPELNFPVEDYEGELLPDLKGRSPAEVRVLIAKAFSGTAVSRHSGQRSSQGWPTSGSSSPNLPAPEPWQLQQWLPGGCLPTGLGAAEPGETLAWGRKQRRSRHPAIQRTKQQRHISGLRAGLGALEMAGIPAGGYVAQQRYQPGLPPNRYKQHPAAAAAAARAAAASAAAAAAAAGGPSPSVAAAATLRSMGAPAAILRELQHQLHPHQLHGLQVGLSNGSVKPMHQIAPVVVPGLVFPGQQQPGQLPVEQAMLSKMTTDLQKLSRHCLAVQHFVAQFRHELTADPAAVEAAAVVTPGGQSAQAHVARTLVILDGCMKQQQALQQLLADTIQLLQPALTEEERLKLHVNSQQLAPAVDTLAASLGQACKAVLGAAVAQDAAACAAAAANPGAAISAGALLAASSGGLVAMQQALAPGLDKIPPGSARAQRMARLSKAIRASQDNMAVAKKVLSGV